MDEIRDKFYDLDEFIEELNSLSNQYKNKVNVDYIEQIDAIWSDACDELEELRQQVERIEKAENAELINEYYREAI